MYFSCNRNNTAAVHLLSNGRDSRLITGVSGLPACSSACAGERAQPSNKLQTPENFFLMRLTNDNMKAKAAANALTRWLVLMTLLSIPLTGLRAEPVDFRLDDLDGNPLQLSDYRGQWVVVNFWASWCSPCIRELPELVAYQDANPGARVIGVNFEETSAAETKAFLQPFQVNFPHVKIGGSPLVPFEPLEGLPTTVVVNPAGEIVERHMGPVTAEHLESVIDRHRH